MRLCFQDRKPKDPANREEGRPRCHTFGLLLGNLPAPVVICEWHAMEALTRFKLWREARTDCNPRGGPEGNQIPRRSWDKTGAVSLFHPNSSLCPKDIRIHLKLNIKDKQKPVAFFLEWHCLTDPTTIELLNDATVLKQLMSEEKKKPGCHASWSANWGTLGCRRAYFSWSLLHTDNCSERGIHMERLRDGTVVDWCRPIRLAYQQSNQVSLVELAWSHVAVESQRNSIAVSQTAYFHQHASIQHTSV